MTAIIGAVVLLVWFTFAAAQQPIGGFGADTPGGAGGAVFHVTSLTDDGPGTLRDAVAQGNRTIVFDVAGDITLRTKLIVGPASAFLTIDGCSAPAPGITIRDGFGIILRETHDVILRCLRIRNVHGFGDQSQDGISVQFNTFNVLIHHVSVHGSIDGNIDIGAFPAGTSVHDVTVAWSILAEPADAEANMLIKYNPSRVTLHHNLFVGARQRNPQVRIDDAGTPATDTTVDMRNNLIFDWSGCCATQIWFGPWANVVANYYSCPACAPVELERALRIQNGARAFTAGNVSGQGSVLDGVGTEPLPFPAPKIGDEDAACAAAERVRAEAGVRPLDTVDQQYLAGVVLSGCDGSPPPPPPPGEPDLVVDVLAVRIPRRSRTAQISETVRNVGQGTADASMTAFYLSSTAERGPDAILLGQRPVSVLGPGGGSAGATTVEIPVGVAPGRYYVVVVTDADATVPEANEGNNSRAKRVRVR